MYEEVQNTLNIPYLLLEYNCEVHIFFLRIKDMYKILTIQDEYRTSFVGLESQTCKIHT